jgi:hypothetical protein
VLNARTGLTRARAKLDGAKLAFSTGLDTEFV